MKIYIKKTDLKALIKAHNANYISVFRSGGMIGYAAKNNLLDQLVDPNLLLKAISYLVENSQITIAQYDTLMTRYKSGSFFAIYNNKKIKKLIKLI